MKYIERYIAKLSPDNKVVRSETSNSVYVTLDNTFKVRLSDHLPNDAGLHSNDVCVTSVYGGDGFIVTLGDTRIPMYMGRADAERYVKTTYTNHRVTNVSKAYKWLLAQSVKKREAEKKRKETEERMSKIAVPEGPKTVNKQEWSYLERTFSGNPNARTSWVWFEAMTCLNKVTAWKSLPPQYKAEFRKAFDQHRLNAEAIMMTVCRNQKVKWTETEVLVRGMEWTKGIRLMEETASVEADNEPSIEDVEENTTEDENGYETV